VHNVGVSSTDADRAQTAFDAAVAGDVEALVSMLDPGLEWRGPTRGHLWWRRTPA